MRVDYANFYHYASVLCTFCYLNYAQLCSMIDCDVEQFKKGYSARLLKYKYKRA